MLDRLELRLLIPPRDQRRFDRLIVEHHYLKAATLVGEQLRHVATYQGRWLARWGHPLALVETFVDPQRYQGTAYKASGWSHLHFDITSRQPSGEWGIQDAYAHVWETWQRWTRPMLVAVERPHLLAPVGQTVVLDATKSWSRTGRIARCKWTFGDGFAEADRQNPGARGYPGQG